MLEPSRKRGFSGLEPEKSSSKRKRAKTAAASTRSDTISADTTVIANAKTIRPNVPLPRPTTLIETPSTHSNPSTSPPSSVSAETSDDASTTSSLDPDESSSPSPSASPSSSSSNSPSPASSPTRSPTQTQPPQPIHLSTLPPPQKPPIAPIAPLAPTTTLHSRLSSFLPALAAANQELELERAAGRLAERDIENLGSGDEEQGEGGKAYIEMELGLGVLEERREGVESEDEEEGESEGEVVGVVGGGTMGGEKDVLGKLLGRERRGREGRPGIEVVDGM